MSLAPQPTTVWDARRLRQLDLLLWESLTTRSAFQFDNFVYHTSSLADLIGEAEYVGLVDDCIECEVASGLGGADFTPLVEGLQARLFPRSCQCRIRATGLPISIRFHRFDDFDLVHLRLDFSDETLTRTMKVLFHRTPDIDLMRCESCGDLWVCNLDQNEWEQNLILLEPDYDGAHRPWDKWVNLLRPMEDYVEKNYGLVTTKSPDLRAWQEANNTPESFALYADPQ